MDSAISISARGIIEYRANLLADLAIFVRSRQCCLLLTIAALSYVENIQQFVQFVFIAKGANHVNGK